MVSTANAVRNLCIRNWLSLCGFPTTSWPLINKGLNCVGQLEKNMHLNGPTQFKPLLLKSQLDWSRKRRKCSKAKHHCLPDQGEGLSELWPIWWHLALLGPAMCAAPGKILICSASLSSEVAMWHTSGQWDLSRLLPKALGSYTISVSSPSPSSSKPTLCFCRSEARTGDWLWGKFYTGFPCSFSTTSVGVSPTVTTKHLLSANQPIPQKLLLDPLRRVGTGEHFPKKPSLQGKQKRSNDRRLKKGIK